MVRYNEESLFQKNNLRYNLLRTMLFITDKDRYNE